MFNSFLSLGPFQLGIVFISALIFLAVISFFISRIFSGSITYKASDGTSFTSKKEKQDYELILRRLLPLYGRPADTKSNQANQNTLDLDRTFLELLKTEGFSNLKLLLTYKEDFIKLSKLLEGNY